jgi:hypothetical protein
VDLGAALEADGEPAERGEPGEGALDDPAMGAETGRGLDALSREARHRRLS